ncbi:Deoxyguanosinetriphosphate triphosphohydrolase [Candidatus Omnitrophus magneticus]|uniref:Deoxyguanosinetriphosphate triphosphohydrolase-like protein n=1 Tax=Candidatus Omnitrophus magneticus TaxID=1609969 RepID=A0A0F0CKQ0_9BACT|nr:Deoxyguanosinetriphosphate triphosphohydrolase [Candidatus Omnitrophus magneticus]
MLYTKNDKFRLPNPKGIDKNISLEEYRTDWRRDYARLLHSPSFRRLQGKMQLFPCQENDFFRNRLTHSLEVAQIAKSITNKLNHTFKKQNKNYFIDSDLVEFAALAHDLGHPPFGHFGEEVLDKKMLEYGGFESNAQTLRILTKIEKKFLIKDSNVDIVTKNINKGKDIRLGLNLSMRTLASILKYDSEIPIKSLSRKKPQKGYYYTEREIVKTIKEKVTNDKQYSKDFKTIECQIMDFADDIAYSTYDLEDSLKAEFVKPIDLFCADESILKRVSKKVTLSLKMQVSLEDVRDRIYNLFSDILLASPPDENLKKQLDWKRSTYLAIEFANEQNNNHSKNSYYRTRFSSNLISKSINSISIDKINLKVPALTKVQFDIEKLIDVEILKNFIFELQILSPKVQIIAFRAKEIIETIFDVLSNKNGDSLLPYDFRELYKASVKKSDKMRIICDFIAGMTDRYAIEFYGRLTSENPQTIFKPF